jgi:2-keto-4-pentenoate hydratase
MTMQLLADELWRARSTGTMVRLTDTPIESISIQSAYDVQDAFVSRQLARPDAVAGWKVGCTSRAIREQFGLSQPVAARIFRSQVHGSGTALDASAFIDCAVEAEIVFRIEAGTAAAVGIGVELHHYRFFHGQPSSQELIAGNALQAGLVVGEWHDVATIGALENVRTDLLVNGEVVATGVGADILDAGPMESLRWLQSPGRW